MKIKTALLFILLFWIVSCSSFHEETICLDKLLKQYDRTIETNHHLYVLKSKFSCDGCIDIIFEQFNISLTNTVSPSGTSLTRKPVRRDLCFSTLL